MHCETVLDAEGLPCLQYNENDLRTFEADVIVAAIGQKGELEFAKDQGVSLISPDRIEADPVTFQTPIPAVFAGGDVVYGPKSVVDAVQCGKEASESIHRFLNGNDLKENREKDLAYYKPDISEVNNISRAFMPKQELEKRRNNFNETALGFNEKQIKSEVARCLECGGCAECDQCVDICEPKAIDHSMQAENIKIKVGSIIVATGFDLMDPSPIKQFGYGRFPNVFTSFEFERLSNATGPTGGKILIRDENGHLTKSPKSVAILHCVGSRDKNYHEYCSRVCCMAALKYTHLIKEKVGEDTEVYDFYIDQRCFGKGYEEFYQRCQNEGTNFVRGKVADITDRVLTPEEEGKLIAVAEDTLLGQCIRVPVDMVVLCVAMEARKDAVQVGRTFGINLGADGFFLE